MSVNAVEIWPAVQWRMHVCLFVGKAGDVYIHSVCLMNIMDSVIKSIMSFMWVSVHRRQMRYNNILDYQ